jgi:3-oxoacyl-[acyl-carrier protein] reductase
MMATSNFSLPEFLGKSVLIRGASTGIGAALARAFAAQGARVGLHYNSSKEATEALAAEITEAGGTVVLVKADACNSEEFAAAVKSIAEQFGGLDGLINNAGGMVKRIPYEDVTDADYDAIMDLNARSVLVASKAALPYLKKQGGFVINTTSIAARNGTGGGAGHIKDAWIAPLLHKSGHDPARQREDNIGHKDYEQQDSHHRQQDDDNIAQCINDPDFPY